MDIDQHHPSWIWADWKAPADIKAGVSTRLGGRSHPPYDSLNLAFHVGDNPRHVKANRLYLKELLGLPAEPIWLEQVHGKRIIRADENEDLIADGIYADQPGMVCVIISADCVPLLLCNRLGRRVAAVHVGWRGFCAGIVSEVIGLFERDSDNILVWIGPHISTAHYEVGDDVYYACRQRDNQLEKAFTKNNNGRWNASLETMIRHELTAHNIRDITSTGQCTYEMSRDFYSYRRDNQTGRMASLIWIDRN